MKNKIIFIQQYIKHPRKIGSLFPSSKFLSDEITNSINGEGSSLIEIGAGTGVFTKKIKSKFNNHKFYVFEKNKSFHESLLNINDIHLYEDALHLNEIVNDNTIISDIISGLPIRSMDKKTSNKILVKAFDLLKENGNFIQFTYGLKSPINKELLDENNMVLSRKKVIYRNIPPATIYIYKKINSCKDIEVKK
jgi:phospholipid N-methyltransferase